MPWPRRAQLVDPAERPTGGAPSNEARRNAPSSLRRNAPAKRPARCRAEEDGRRDDRASQPSSDESHSRRATAPSLRTPLARQASLRVAPALLAARHRALRDERESFLACIKLRCLVILVRRL